MFGYLRFILAIFVLISHLNVRFFSLNPGVIAVTIFYLLAGFVVSHLYNDIFSNKKNKLLQFYTDRIVRIFTLYIIVATITIIFLLITHYGNPHFTLIKLLYNYTIIPLNYYMYIDSTILTNPKWQLIPPAWSLGTELLAYLLLPLALISKRFFYISFIITLTIYIIANMKLLNSDYFGYRFIIGVFFIFLFGSLIQQKKKIETLTLYMLLLIIAFFLYKYNNLSGAYAKETLIGIIVGIPIVTYISTKSNLIFNKTLGRLSYAIFLTHFLTIWILNYLSINSYIIIIVLSISIINSAILIKLESAIFYKIKRK